MNKTKEVSLWLRILLYVIVGLGILASFFDGSLSILTFIGIGIALLCAEKCSKWANEIDKNMNWAYALGFALGLVGLIIYHIYIDINGMKDKKIKKMFYIIHFVFWIIIGIIVFFFMFMYGFFV